MDIENLSFLTEITNEDASHVNGGAIDYDAWHSNTCYYMEQMANFYASLGMYDYAAYMFYGFGCG